MFYETEINGIRVGARFSDEDISGLFLPLLGQLARLRERKGRRVLVFLAAPPGAGKTTLADFLKSCRNAPGTASRLRLPVWTDFTGIRSIC